MKQSILIIFLISCFSFINSETYGQSSTVTIQYGGYVTECCSANSTSYFCFNSPNNSGYCGQTTLCNTQNFFDPIPAGNIVTQISVAYYTAGCAGGNMQGTLNGSVIGTVAETNSGCACTGIWYVNGNTTSNYPCGITNAGYTYNYGGNNSFQFCALTGQICIDRAQLTISYAPANQANPASQPSAISGNAAVCAGVANTYSIPAVANATGYTWTVPAGWTINSGQGTTSISATAGGAGNICVTASNLCGTSAPTCIPITINTPSTAPTGATATPNPICAGSSTTLSVSGGSLGIGASWNWYSGSCGGTFVGSGSSIVVSPVGLTTYYVRAQGTCNTTTCASVTVNVNTNSTAPTGATATPNPVCAGSSTTLSVSGGTLGTGASWNWYSGSCGGTLVGSGSSISVSPASNTTYYVLAQGTCNTTTCASVTVNVNTISIAPTGATATPDPICSGSSTTLSVSGGTLGTGASWNWYSGSCGGTLVGTGSSISVSPGGTTTYYVLAQGTCNTTTCASVTVNVNTISTAPTGATATPNPICAGSSTTLSVSGGTLGTGASWNWYSGSCGGTLVGTGSSISISPASNTTYYVLAQGTCNTTTCSSVLVTVNPVVDPSWNNPSPICAAAGSINLDFYITGTTLGTWSGTGVSGSTFDPSVGSQSVTYTVGIAPCQETSTQTITVSAFDATWINPGPICDGSLPINLNSSVTGSLGGTFTGTGVTANFFDPTGLGGTTVNITYTVGTAPCTEVSTLPVTVNLMPVITDTSSGVVCEGNTIYLTPSSGGTWSSSDPTVATIDNTGMVTGISAGTTNMVFIDGVTGCQNSSTTGLVTVNPTPTVTVVTNDTVCEGNTINFLPSSGGSWTSSDPTVATIDNTGLITGISGGTATMVFTDVTTGCTSNLTSGLVVVNPIPVIIDTSSGVVCEGNTIYLTPSSGGTWTSGDPTVATIDNTGMVTGISAGTTTMVFADGVTGCQNSSATGLVTVNPMPIVTVVTNDTVCEGITINFLPSTGGTWTSSDPTIATIDNTGLITGISGGTATMVFTDGTTGCTSNLTSGLVVVNPMPILTDTSGGVVCEGNTIYLTPSTGGTWTSSDPTVATIDNTGMVTGISGGTATMVFADGVTGCQNSSATGLVTVNPMPIVTVVTNDTVCEGITINFLPSTGGTWTSSDPTIATIDNTGLITGISGGTATMVFTDGTTGCTSNLTSGLVVVNPIPVITDTSSGVVCEGNTIYLTPSTGGTWTSSDPTVATIDNTGMVTGISGGTATMVFADGVTGCQNSSATGLVTVNPTPTVTVVTNDTVCEESTINFLPSTGGTWTSSDPTVATIDNTGLITGISGGTATMVFADVTTGCTSNLTSGLVVVNPIPVITDTSSGVVCEGNTIYLTPSSGGTWTSSDPAVATIDNTGLVTGISGGNATMIFTNTLGCSSSTLSGLVTVSGVTAVLSATPSSGLMPLEVVFTNGSTPAVTYTWDFGDGSAITNIFVSNHTYSDFGDYLATLIVTDGLCYDTATVSIEVIGISSILIPNVFTPNGDGQNDVFTVSGTNLESVEVEIFNRWGQKMFEWKHVKGYWDGRTQSGIEAADGTYFYIITAKGLDGEEYFKKGGFSLIR